MANRPVPVPLSTFKSTIAEALTAFLLDDRYAVRMAERARRLNRERWMSNPFRR